MDAQLPQSFSRTVVFRNLESKSSGKSAFAKLDEGILSIFKTANDSKAKLQLDLRNHWGYFDATSAANVCIRITKRPTERYTTITHQWAHKKVEKPTGVELILGQADAEIWANALASHYLKTWEGKRFSKTADEDPFDKHSDTTNPVGQTCPVGHYVPNGFKFCGECGTSLQKEISCKACGMRAESTTQKFCGMCGGNL